MRASTFVPLAAAAVALGSPVALAQAIERMKLTDGELTCVQIYAETQQMDSVIALNANNPAPAAVPAAATVAPAAPAPSPADPVAAGFASALAGAMGGATNVAAAGALAPTQAGVPVGVYADPKVQDAIRRARAAGYSDAQITQMMQLGAARAGYPVAATAGSQYQVAAAQAALASGQQAQAAALAGQAAPAAVPAPAAAAAPALGGFLGALTGRAGIGGVQAGNLLGAAMQGAAAPAPAAAPIQPRPVAGAAAAPAPGGSSLAMQARARKEHLTSLFLSRGCKVSDMPK